MILKPHASHMLSPCHVQQGMALPGDSDFTVPSPEKYRESRTPEFLSVVHCSQPIPVDADDRIEERFRKNPQCCSLNKLGSRSQAANAWA